MKVAKVNFNDAIGNDWLFGGISEQFVRYCVEGPNSFDPAVTPTYPEEVQLHFFNCPGGEVYEGYAMFGYFRDLVQQGVKVTAYVHGLCASIASLVVLAADERYIGPLGSVMIHKPLVDAGPWANADDHRKAAEMLDTIEKQVTGVYASRTTIDPATLPDLMRAETTFDDATAIANGFATGPMPAPTVAVGEPAAKVLNYAKVPLKPTPAAMATLTATEEDSLVDKIFNKVKGLFKNEAPEPAPAPAPTNASADVTDGEPMYFDGDLAQGTAVYSDAEMTTAYPDGDAYNLADGRVAAVAAGVISSLTDAAAEDAAPETPAQNSADLDVANNRIAELEAQNSVLNRKVTGLQNKLKNVVPGSNGNPTPAGTQSILNKANTTPTEGRVAERSLFTPKK